MALPPHVSRVAKDYVPSGWSIMEDVVVSLGATINGAGNWYVGLFDDDSVVVESAHISIVSKASTDSGNHGKLALVYADNDGSLTPMVKLTADASRLLTYTMGTEQFLSLPLDEQSLAMVPMGKLLYVLVTNVGSSWSISRPTLRMRIRRRG
jgi:hypothetical protein